LISCTAAVIAAGGMWQQWRRLWQQWLLLLLLIGRLW
jgi:hypothetical protein